MRPTAPLLLLCGLLACASPPAPPAVPLFDADHAPEVLVESRELALPPATGGNRFLAGWWPRRTAEGIRLAPDTAGARLEGVHLGTTPRRLRLGLVGDTAPGALLKVAVAGRELPPVALSGDVVEVPLPGDLARGRFAVQLGFPADSSLAVRGVGFDRALPAGVVELVGGALRQGGVSLVEVVRPLAGPARLVGRFVPPADAAPGQRFEILGQDGEGSETLLWSWEEGWRARLGGATELAVPLTASGGWLTLRLFAATPGPPATWEALGISGEGVDRAPAAAASPPAAPPPAPRVVILYALDALRADAVGHLGGAAGVTPTLDAIAAAGASFRQHTSTAPNTLPSTKTLLTGRIWRQRGGWALPAGGTPTLAESFRSAGYRTGLFSGNVYVSPGYGLDRGFETAPQETLFDSYADRERPPYNDNSERVHHAALGWLGSLGPGEKAFLYLHPVLPHNPYDPPQPFRDHFAPADGAAVDGSTETLLAVRNQRLAADAPARQRIAGLYRGGLAYADAQLGAFLAAVAARYPAEQVLVAVTSDHGEELFDHGGVLHGYTLYDEQLRIPLLLRWPGAVTAGRRIDAPTDTADLHRALRTLAEAGRPATAAATGPGPGGAGPAGSNAADAAAPTGPSSVLWDLLRASGDPAARHEPRFAAASSIKGGIFAIRTPRWKVVWAPRTGTHWGAGEGLGRNRDAEAVFDLRADPGEKRNLAGFATDPEVRWLRSRLLAWAQAEEPDEEEAAPPPEDEATRKKLEALGYAN
jgi:arylsulfatase A-like enzyme